MRRAALEERTALVDETRKEAEKTLAEARATLERDVQSARTRLDADAEALAAEATEKILGRRVS
jgi:F0F1-type ATP synthase membrane subunit b/b'